MAVKSVIEVEVDDGAFKTFKALFDQYKAQAAEMPEAWAKVGAETGKASSNFGDMVAAMMAQATLADALATKQRKAREESEKSGRAWRNLKSDTKAVASNILDATKSLMKWGAILEVAGGLLGAGGIWGIDRLASGVSDARRSSLGVGTGYGSQKAFETDFGRFVDPNSMLSGVNEALHDVRKRWMLSTAGASAASIASGDSGAVGASLLENVKKLVDRTPANQLQQLSDSRGLGQFFSLQDLVRLRAMSGSELSDQARAYGRDSKSFGLSDATARKWADLDSQLTRAGTKIKTVLIDGLTPLTPSLSHLSDSFAKAVGTFLGVGDPVRMKKIGDSLDKFATYIGSDDFQKDVKSFAADVGTLADAVRDALHDLGKNSFQDALFGAGAGFLMGGPGGAVVGGVIGYGVGRARDGVVPNGPGDRNRPSKWYDPGSWMSRDGGVLAFQGGSAQRGFVAGTEKQYGLPTGLLTGIWGAESNFGRDPNSFHENAEHAEGPFQFTPGAARDYGVTDRTSLPQTADAAGRYVRDLLKKYHGEVAKALAAYNWGAGNLDRDIRNNGSDWQSHLPSETAKYIAKVLSIAKKGAPNTLTVNNNTGGSAIVAGSQVGI